MSLRLGSRPVLALGAAILFFGACMDPANIATRPRRHGWSRDPRARLERYRADLAPLVADAAWFVFPPDA